MASRSRVDSPSAGDRERDRPRIRYAFTVFHDQVQNFLRSIPSHGSRPPNPPLNIDPAALRTHLLARLKRLPDGQGVRSLHESWSERLAGLADFLRRELPATTTTKEALSVGKRILEVAIPIPGPPKRTSIEDLEARRLLSTFDWEGFDIARYAAENRLTRLTEEFTLERTLLATTFLRLSGRDAVRWLLTVETERSTGPWDNWSVSRDVLGELLTGLTEHSEDDTGEMLLPCSAKTLKRLVRMGVATTHGGESEGRQYEIRASMTGLVGETLADDPWRATVRAALGDETQSIIASAPGANLRATSELSRIVTHEVRNALVPVRHHATALRDGAVESGVRDRANKVLSGVNRVLHFVEELVTISEAVATDRMKTTLLSFLSEAIGPLEGSERVVFTLEDQELELPREPLARALRNVVQNALQLTSHPAPIGIEASVVEGSLLLEVEDGGKGVPAHLRERIFEDGFTTRDGGSGFGLSMTRRILTELGGSVRCEASSLGGARFVLAIPLSEPTP